MENKLHINLFNPQFSTRKKLFSSRTVVFVLLLAAFENISAGLWFDYLDRQLEQQYASLLQRQQQHQSQMEQALDVLTANTSEVALNKQLQMLRQQIASEQRILDTVQDALGSSHGYAEHLRELGQGALDNVWITGLHISGAGRKASLHVQAAALYPELVAEYVKRLRRQPLFGETGEQAIVVRHVNATDSHYVRFELVRDEQGVLP